MSDVDWWSLGMVGIAFTSWLVWSALAALKGRRGDD